MAVKVLVNQIGQHIIADTKQVTRKDTDELVSYWVENPRVVLYGQNEESGQITVNFVNYCLVSDETQFSISSSNIVAILEPREDVLNSYNTKVFGNESSTDSVEDGADTDDADGTDGVRAEGSSPETDDSVGEDEAEPATVA